MSRKPERSEAVLRGLRALRAIENGEFVMVVDRLRKVGVLGTAGERVTADQINFQLRHCRGALYLGLEESVVDALGFGPQSHTGGSPMPARVPFDAVDGVTTGVSANDRLRTIQAALAPNARREQFRVPGHVTPVASASGGLLTRLGIAEAMWELVHRAGGMTSTVLCTVLDERGEVAGPHQLAAVAESMGVSSVSVADVLALTRWLDGWPVGGGAVRMLNLPYLASDVLYLSPDAPTARRELVVTVEQFCVGGHVFGRSDCGCEGRLRQDLAGIPSQLGGVVAIVGTLQPGCPQETGFGLGADALRALGELIAADFGAAILVDDAPPRHPPAYVSGM
jgi:3,4-dihydroxy 2-butanone 4-phosphate synthase/GTP cyclohydrolase II